MLIARGESGSASCWSAHVTQAVTFSEADARLLELFASQLAVAIESAELSEALEQRIERGRTLDRHNRLISSSLDLDEVLRVIARSAADLAQGRGRLVLARGRGGRDPGARAVRRSFRRRTERSRRFGEGLVGAAARSVPADRRRHAVRPPGSPGQSWLPAEPTPHELLRPVLSGDTLLAVLVMHAREPFRLGPSEGEILDSFVAQAAVAIQNASLYSSVRRSQQVLQAIVEQTPRWSHSGTVRGATSWPTGAGSGRSCRRAQDVIGRTMEELFPPDRAARMREYHNQVLETRASVEYESLIGEGDDARRT